MLELGLAVGLAAGGIGGFAVGIWFCIPRIVQLGETARRAVEQMEHERAEHKVIPFRTHAYVEDGQRADFIASCVRARGFVKRGGR